MRYPKGSGIAVGIFVGFIVGFATNNIATLTLLGLLFGLIGENIRHRKTGNPPQE